MALSKGCMIGLIVGIVLFVIAITIVVLVWVYKDELVEAGVGKMVDSVEMEIVKNLPEGYTSEDVHRIMGDFKAAVLAGKISGPEVQNLANTFQTAIADKEISREEGDELLRMIQGALGQEPPEYMPEETPDDTMQAVPDSV